MNLQPVLIDGRWRPAAATGSFQAEDPARQQPLPDQFPVSAWADCDAALTAAAAAHAALLDLPAARLADFLERFADRLAAASGPLVEMAHAETALPRAPRLADVELPRTTNQLRQAAAAARDGSWCQATIDRPLNLRSCLASLGPVWVFGPNNFPFAYNGIAGGDFAAAIAAGNPVIAKANSSHPGTSRLLALEAHQAVLESGLPPATVQLLYRTSHADGERAVADPRTGATGYTGSRSAGLQLKAAADRAGKPIYLELSSVNPVVILPGALAERSSQIVQELSASCLLGTGQFCTSPGLILLVDGPETPGFIRQLVEALRAAPVGTLLSAAVARSLAASVAALRAAGAELLLGGTPGGGTGYSHSNTLLRASGAQFLANPHGLQTEAFGNCALLVVAQNLDQAAQLIDCLEGNLTGSIYSHTQGHDDQHYEPLARRLRQRVGRLLNDKMPTGVAVSPAMNHGGPYPATGHPGFTAVGIPPALTRFAMLQCFDQVRPSRLPPALRDENPTGTMWRRIDGRWTQS
jgi:NADP-dependent aldehyde dehydrogenase